MDKQVKYLEQLLKDMKRQRSAMVRVSQNTARTYEERLLAYRAATSTAKNIRRVQIIIDNMGVVDEEW